jgi:hypothetical protein
MRFVARLLEGKKMAVLCRITSSVNLISNGKAIAEVIGSPDNHETSVYSCPGDQYGLPFIPGSGWLN